MTKLTTDNRERMSCMEIWGGNRAIDKSFQAPGLDIHVNSQPYQGDEAGGDIYYLTSCASGRVSRFLLADVSGHGDAAAGLAKSLRDLLRQNVNRISQDRFVTGMNREFRSLAEDEAFATAVVATFFEPTRTLEISVAGHPYPIYYRASTDRWVHLDPATGDNELENIPLGIVNETSYPLRKVQTEPGDMFLLYTDAFIESSRGKANGGMLGVNGMLNLLNGNSGLVGKDVIPFLRSSIESLDEENLASDDASLILGQFTRTRVRLRDNLFSPVKLLGAVRDRTFLK